MFKPNSVIQRRIYALGVAAFLMTVFVSRLAFAQASSLSNDLQSIRPNLFLSEELNERGMCATQQIRVRPCDQIWLISTRKVDCYSLEPSHLDALELVENDWQAASADKFKIEHDSNPQLKSVFYVHGNMTDLNWSIVRGLEVYQNLIGADPNAPPVRFVILSWPSERQTVPIRDALIKARKAIWVGYSLRALLDSLDGDRPALIGYSFGSQVVVSALQSPFREKDRGKYHVTLIAPAFERDFIHCGFDGCRIAEDVERMEAYVNATDRVIKANSCLCRRKYRRSQRCDHLVSSKLDGCCDFLREIDITDCQSKHSIILYSQQPAIVSGFAAQLKRICDGCQNIVAPLQHETMLPTAELEAVASPE